MVFPPCVRCGYCCKKAPCVFGVIGFDGICVNLVGSGPGHYECAIYELIQSARGSDVSPAFGAGCSSSLNSERRKVLG